MSETTCLPYAGKREFFRQERQVLSVSDVQLKCPSCGAPINFDAASGKMKCAFCDASFSVEEVNQFNGISQANAELSQAQQAQQGVNAEPAEGQPGWVEPPPTYLDEKTGKKMAEFKCDSCGGEIIGEADMVSAKCPWCNNNFVSTSQLTSTRVPDRMIPFSMTKEQALDAFKAQMKDLKLLPKAFRNVSVEDIQGVYVPYWLYDATVAGTATFEGEQLSTWSDKDYEYTEHNVYQLNRAGHVEFLDVPVAGTTKVTDTITESIEPYDYTKSTAFSPAYLTGFMTNKYDVSAEMANPRALERMKDSTIETLRDSIHGYQSVTEISSSVNPAYGDLEYVFLPVWLMNVEFRGKNYNYAMNGQSGKFVGTFPVDKGKYWGGLIGILAGVSIILGAVFIPFLAPLVVGWF